MKKIIICGSKEYAQNITDKINTMAIKSGHEAPSICIETEDSVKLLTIAKEETFPIFILDKTLPSPKNNWFNQDAFNIASQIRRVRCESVEQYCLPDQQKAFIVIFSTQGGYTASDRGAMDRFWSPNIFLEKAGDVTESAIASLAVGTTVFDNEWMIPTIANMLRERFSRMAR